MAADHRLWPRYGAARIGHALGLCTSTRTPTPALSGTSRASASILPAHTNSWSQSQIERNILNKLDAGHNGGFDLGPRLDHGVSVPGRNDRVRRSTARNPSSPPAAERAGQDLGSEQLSAAEAVLTPYLAPFESQLVSATSGGLAQFRLTPKKSGKVTIRLFGEVRRNAAALRTWPGGRALRRRRIGRRKCRQLEISERLHADRTYLVRVKVIYAPEPDALSVMYW